MSIKYQEILLFLGLDKHGMLFFMLMNVKMPIIVGIFNIYEQEKFHAQSS